MGRTDGKGAIPVPGLPHRGTNILAYRSIYLAAGGRISGAVSG